MFNLVCFKIFKLIRVYLFCFYFEILISHYW